MMKDSKMAKLPGSGAAFKDAYTKLQTSAEALREQREPDIDNLLTIVTESVAAYKVCKERIDAVERALEEALTSAGLDKRPVA
jgi:exodeoxyribonuclease VII small subunit